VGAFFLGAVFFRDGKEGKSRAADTPRISTEPSSPATTISSEKTLSFRDTRKVAPPPKAPSPPEPFVNSIGMKFAWISRGSFRRGDHRVTITRGFYTGVYPVTQAQWQEVMPNNPSRFKGDDNCPVEEVSWEDCQEFCAKLRQKDGKPYRLPTEAEWEYACRAGTTTAYYTGDGEDDLKRAGWYYVNSGGKTHPVGELAPNDWGLYDMHGNVWQWCQDWHGPYPAGDIVDLEGPDKGEIHVLRGGCWGDYPGCCCSAFRLWFAPGGRSLGCRVCFRPD
jgi:formylglycine-generating enzyme required for sulfatase activity